MRRTRYQSRLEKKLKQDNKVRTDVSRKSLPKRNDDTLVPDITFSNILPETTLQNTSVQHRRSSLHNTRSSDVDDKSSRKSFASADLDHRNSSTDDASEIVVQDDTKKRTARGKGTSPEAFSKGPTQTEVQQESEVKYSDAEATHSESVKLGLSENTPKRTTRAKSSKIPTSTQRKENKNSESKYRTRSQRLNKDIDDSKTSDENSPKNSSLNTKSSPQKDAEQMSTATEVETIPPGNPIHSKHKIVTSSMENVVDDVGGDVEKTLENNEGNVNKRIVSSVDVNAEENVEENITEKSKVVTKNCKVVLDEFLCSETPCPPDENIRDRSTVTSVPDKDVSAETLEIRERIRKKFLCEAVSSDEEENSPHGVVNSERLFDSLFVPARKSATAEKTIDRSSFYNGTIPSSLLSPEHLSKGEQETEGWRDDERLTQRFAALKKCNAPEAASSSPKNTQDANVPSFTLEEEATNNLEEVTTGVQRAITLCEEDSDADLDIVMSSKKHKRGGAKIPEVDLVFCDFGTSMGLPLEQKDSESFVLMIESASRDAIDVENEKGFCEEEQMNGTISFRQAQLEVEDACVTEGDHGQELKEARKSKLQSTLLPSPKFAASVAVCTGPSLMEPDRVTEISQIIETGPHSAKGNVEDLSCCCEENSMNRHHANDTIRANADVNTMTPERDAVKGMNPEHDSVNKVATEFREQNDPGLEPGRTELSRIGKQGETTKVNRDAIQLEDDDSLEIVFQTFGKGHPIKSIAPITTTVRISPDAISVEEAPPLVEDPTESNGSSVEFTSQEIRPGIPELADEGAIQPKQSALNISPSLRLFSMTENQPQTNDPFAGKNHLDLIDLIDDVHDDTFLSEYFSSCSHDFPSEMSRQKKDRKSKDGQPVLLFHLDTPKITSSLTANYKIGGRTRARRVSETPQLCEDTERKRVPRRTLFDETAEIPEEILPITGRVEQCPEKTLTPRPKSFVLDSARLPNFEEAHVDMQFDMSELKKRGEELFQAAARTLFDRNPEHKKELQAALEDLFSSNEAEIKRLMILLVKKSALKELCDSRKETYFVSQARLQRTRKYIEITAQKLLPDYDSNVVTVFGFNPLNFDLPPPAHIREINKRKAREEEDRLRKRFKQSL